MTNRKKILYVASTASHLRRFHEPYISALRKEYDVLTLANGDGVDFSIPISKKMLTLRHLATIRKIRRICRAERICRANGCRVRCDSRRPLFRRTCRRQWYVLPASRRGRGRWRSHGLPLRCFGEWLACRGMLGYAVRLRSVRRNRRRDHFQG